MPKITQPGGTRGTVWSWEAISHPRHLPASATPKPALALKPHVTILGNKASLDVGLEIIYEAHLHRACKKQGLLEPH